MILFIFASSVALFGKMSETVVVNALQLTEVMAIVHSMFAPIAIITDHRHIVLKDLIQEISKVCN